MSAEQRRVYSSCAFFLPFCFKTKDDAFCLDFFSAKAIGDVQLKRRNGIWAQRRIRNILILMLSYYISVLRIAQQKKPAGRFFVVFCFKDLDVASRIIFLWRAGALIAPR
ncbi:MAG: hypothetical protein Q8P67_27300 [archaeon]|nr:hypothetical protein [archaeon]